MTPPYRIVDMDGQVVASFDVPVNVEATTLAWLVSLAYTGVVTRAEQTAAEDYLGTEVVRWIEKCKATVPFEVEP
jgi:hypothetical protein